MILNKDYYIELLKKFNNIEVLQTQILNNNFFLLTVKIILNHLLKNNSIHFNLCFKNDYLQKIGKHIFIELAYYIFKEYKDLPSFAVGDKLKYSKNNKLFEIESINNNKYNLSEISKKRDINYSPSKIIDLEYDNIAKNFIPIKTKQGKDVKNYKDFFENITSLKPDFIPSSFERNSVFIARKTFWDSLDVKDKIPSKYLPNQKDGEDYHEIKSINSLQDCIMYITPKYEICYQKILQQGKKIDTIVVYNTEDDKIPQIIQDKNKFKFNLILLTNYDVPNKNDQIPCWNWFKEEIELINSL